MTTTWKSSLIVALLWYAGCKEEFPPYDEPKNVLVGDLVVVAPDTVQGEYDGFSKSYYLDNPIILRVNVTNAYDNLLQGAAQVNGKITVQSFCAVPRLCIVPLSNGDLRKPPVFYGNIAVAPGDSAQFSTFWIALAPDGKYVFEDNPYTVNGGYRYYSPITFIASAEVQLFERVQPIRFGNLEFKVVFKIAEL